MPFGLRGVTKSFGVLRAVDGVDLQLAEGEVTALLGENGAGKSTLMKLLYGVHQPDAGEIRLADGRAGVASPRDAIKRGVGMVFQNFSLFPALSVYENLLLSWPGAPWASIGRRPEVLARLRALAPAIEPGHRILDLSVGERQLVEIARVLNTQARCVILDEPTAVLTPAETEHLYQLIRSLAGEGRAIVLITHKMADVVACADRVVVMRRGKVVEEGPVADRSASQLVQAMVGTAGMEEEAPPAAPRDGAPRLMVAGLCAGNARDISFEMRPGEILGVAGIAGNGQRAFAEALAGVLAPSSGSALLDGRDVLRRSGQDPDARVGYVPELPRENGVAEALSVTVNLALRRLAGMPAFPDWGDEQSRALALMERFDVTPRDARRDAGSLSGGNLQKLVLARELGNAPALVVACYPTMGLDVAATRAVHRRLHELAAQGACVLWFSEDLDELIALSHRIAVMYGGRLAGVLPRASASRHALGSLMSGGMATAA